MLNSKINLASTKKKLSVLNSLNQSRGTSDQNHPQLIGTAAFAHFSEPFISPRADLFTDYEHEQELDVLSDRIGLRCVFFFCACVR